MLRCKKVNQTLIKTLESSQSPRVNKIMFPISFSIGVDQKQIIIVQKSIN